MKIKLEYFPDGALMSVKFVSESIAEHRNMGKLCRALDVNSSLVFKGEYRQQCIENGQVSFTFNETSPL